MMTDLSEIKPEWNPAAVEALFDLPFNDLMFRAQTAHREHFEPNAVQMSTLLSIKTGGCSEDCGYCSQSARHDTGLEREKLLDVAEVAATAKRAKDNGATRFCMGAAWRGPKDADLDKVIEMVREVKALDMEACVTLGMLKEGQAARLKEAGLDFYNHNIDTAPEFYGQVITHTYDDRLDTLHQVREAGISVCCGGIVGMGETRAMRARMIAELACLNPQPESVPINMLVKVPGTPLSVGGGDLDPLEFVRTIAVARITMPGSHVRLSAGRHELGEAVQALCFLAGANSIFYGDMLLTTDNADVSADQALFAKLGLTPEPVKGRRCAEL
jgi:biotin synthase